MQSQIFSVKVDDIPAELEVSNGMIKCISGNTIHFEIAKNDMRSFVHVSSKQILFNFILKETPNKVIISSEYCLNIIKCLDNTIGN